ncbi:CERS1 [Cordylochernes scorpioides]|uniref:CERS1 n=1 Tax=Cordylochernes scorpioides TaxID=51811 RepID=A0ABY6KE76_9ARAC|nr:CERS1 [Cordylochernes scorpioides]
MEERPKEKAKSGSCFSPATAGPTWKFLDAAKHGNYDWSFEEPVPWDIYAIYMVQCSFYLHSLYATLVLDTWRKDSPVMLAHHLVTLALLLLSYGLRYHKTGSLILLLHDICDILLEVAKLNVYFKIQAGVKKPMFEQLANSAFLLFSVTWYVTRLYWYPLKALYTNGAVLSQTGIILPFGILMNSLLWVLQLLHVYWFSMILDFLWRVYSGQIEDLGDTREYDVAEAQHTVSPATNGWVANIDSRT